MSFVWFLYQGFAGHTDGFGSIPSFSTFWNSLRIGTNSSLNVCGRIYQWHHLVLGFSLLEVFFLNFCLHYLQMSLFSLCPPPLSPVSSHHHTCLWVLVITSVASISLLVICSDSQCLATLVLEGCVFPEIHPFLPDCPACWRIIHGIL